MKSRLILLMAVPAIVWWEAHRGPSGNFNDENGAAVERALSVPAAAIGNVTADSSAWRPHVMREKDLVFPDDFL